MIYGVLAIVSLLLLFAAIAWDIIDLCLGRAPWRRP